MQSARCGVDRHRRRATGDWENVTDKSGNRVPCSMSVSCVTCRACEAVGSKFASGVKRLCIHVLAGVPPVSRSFFFSCFLVFQFSLSIFSILHICFLHFCAFIIFHFFSLRFLSFSLFCHFFSFFFFSCVIFSVFPFFSMFVTFFNCFCHVSAFFSCHSLSSRFPGFGRLSSNVLITHLHGD